MSLADAVFPDQFNTAHVCTLIKKSTLDCNALKDYRPVSNLSYISKSVEKVVAVRLQKHHQDNQLYEPVQSACRPAHSTEAALVRVTNDLVCSRQAQTVILVLLDLSAAFDTVDHDILLQRLHEDIGVCGVPLQWFESYLTGLNQAITINKTSASECDIIYGVPQGSVLGPILFTCYTKPLGVIAREPGLSLHIYADDTQLYIAFKPVGESELATERVEACADEISSWMRKNKLQLNDSKTEVMGICYVHNHSKVNIPHIQVGDSEIQPVSVVRNIGAELDETLSKRSHVNSLCNRAHFYLRIISKIRHLLDRRTTATLVHAYVTSWLDNGNALLGGLPQTMLSKVQRVQNAAARLVCLTGRRERITPVLKELHSLPVRQRISFQVLVLTHQALHGTAPQYMTELLSRYQPTRSLRSNDALLLTAPQSRLTSFWDGEFQHAAPRLWNGLPISLRSANNMNRSSKYMSFQG